MPAVTAVTIDKLLVGNRSLSSLFLRAVGVAIMRTKVRVLLVLKYLRRVRRQGVKDMLGYMLQSRRDPFM